MTTICLMLGCSQLTEYSDVHTAFFALIVAFGLLLQILKLKNASRVLLVITSFYGVAVLIAVLGLSDALPSLSWQRFATIQFTSFITHTTITLTSLCLLAATYKWRFMYDSFIYLAMGLSVVAINVISLLARSQFNEFVEFQSTVWQPGLLFLLSLVSGAGLILYGLWLIKDLRYLWRKTFSPFILSLAVVSAMTLLSFKLQRYELDFLNRGQTRYLNGVIRSFKGAIENEVMPLQILLNFKNELTSQEAALSWARSILSSKTSIPFIYSVSKNGQTNWIVSRLGITDKNAPKHSRRYITKLIKDSDPGGTHLIVPETYMKDGYVDITMPYYTGVRMPSYIVAKLNMKSILEEYFIKGLSPSYHIHIDTPNGTRVVQHERSDAFTDLAQSEKFEIFNSPFTIRLTPSYESIHYYFSTLPRLTLIFGLIGALLLGHLLYVYSNLRVSYDEVEKLVLNRTQELINAKRAAEEASESKSLFLANMSHEMRTPLNILSGVADLLSDTELDARQKQYVSMFKQSCVNLLRLVNDLIDMSKIEAGNIELEERPFNLRQFCEDMQSLYRIKASEKGIQLICKVENLKQEWFIGDELRLKQILGNILINAIKFTDVGTVTFLASQSTDDHVVLFQVSDTGIGIPKEMEVAVFERFSQVDNTVTRNRGGAGLGLAIAKDLVGLMSGQIHVHSNLGVGTTFYVELPLKSTDVPKQNPTISMQTATIPQGLRVLVTDDSADNRELMKIYLKNLGCEIEEAENGQVALELVKVKNYDVILMDMQMPVLDGYSATKRIREFESGSGPKRTPIVALTAHALREDREKCMMVGCDAYLSKPVTKFQLVGQIADII